MLIRFDEHSTAAQPLVRLTVTGANPTKSFQVILGGNCSTYFPLEKFTISASITLGKICF